MAKNAAGSKTDYLETIHLAHAGIVSGTAVYSGTGAPFARAFSPMVTEL